MYPGKLQRNLFRAYGDVYSTFFKPPTFLLPTLIQIRTGMLSWVRHWGRPDTEMLGKGAYRLATNDRLVENTTRFLNHEQIMDVRRINYTVEDASPFFSCAHDIESTFKLNNTVWYLTTDSVCCLSCS